MEMPKSAANNHGFNLLGEKSLVLSHIPMFMAPHQFQVFLEVAIDGPPGSDPVKAYLDDRKKSGATEYVLLSDPLVLATLAPDAPDRLTKFTGKLFRGWPFNNPNTAPLIVEALTAHVTRAIYFHSILHQPLLKDLTYLAFHTGECDYLVHELVQPPDLKHVPNPPDFCQVLDGRVTGAGKEFQTGAVKIEFSHVANNVAQKLTAGKKVEGKSGSHHVEAEARHELVFDPNHLMPV
jgi:hypothetical protein